MITWLGVKASILNWIRKAEIDPLWLSARLTLHEKLLSELLRISRMRADDRKAYAADVIASMRATMELARDDNRTIAKIAIQHAEE